MADVDTGEKHSLIKSGSDAAVTCCLTKIINSYKQAMSSVQ